MDEFSVPPSGEPESIEGVPEKEPKSKLGKDSFLTNMSDDLLDVEREHVTQEMREAFLLSIGTDAPFEGGFDIQGGKFSVQFRTKTLGDFHQGNAWISENISDSTTDNQYYSLITEADLVGYLSRIKFAGEKGATEIDFSLLKFEDKVAHLNKFSTAKIALLTKLMMKFIARLEIMREDILSKDFH